MHEMRSRQTKQSRDGGKAPAGRYLTDNKAHGSKIKNPASAGFFIVCFNSIIAFDLCDAILADELALDAFDVIRAAAEYARRLVLFKDDLFLVYKYFNRVTVVDTEILADLDRKNESAQLIDSSDNAC